MRIRSRWCPTIACACWLAACDAAKPEAAPAADGAATRETKTASAAEPGKADPGQAKPASTPLPDCAGVAAKPAEVEKRPPPDAKAKREPADPKRVAKVGEVEIPRAALDAIYSLKVEKYVSRGREIPQTVSDRYLGSIANRLVEQEILRQEVAARGIADDTAALARIRNAQRVGIADYAEHLRRRGETEESIREMHLADVRQQALVMAEGPIEVGDAQLVAEYCRDRAEWPVDREYRVISRLSFETKDAAKEAISALDRGTGMAELATASPDSAYVAHELVAPADSGFSKGIFAAPIGRAVWVEDDSTSYAVIVESSVPAGSLSRELVFDAVREAARQHEIGKRRAPLWTRLLEKYPVTLFGVPERSTAAKPSDDE